MLVILNASGAAQADGDDAGALLAEAGAQLSGVEGAAAEVDREARFVAGVRESFTTGQAATARDLEALVQRLNAAKRRLRQSARVGREAPAPPTPFELVAQAEALPSYDDRFYAVLREQRALRAEATAALHALRDMGKTRELALELERAHGAQARAAQHAQTARAGRARLQQIMRSAARERERQAIEPELQRALAAATEAAEQARAQAARARADVATLRRLTGTSLASAPNLVARYERAIASLRAALQDLYATWERLEPLNHMAARYRVTEALQALPADASAEDVRKAVLSAEADPPMMD